jgi:hypothetical protein
LVCHHDGDDQFYRTVLIAMAICMSLAGCAAHRNAGYKVVTVSYDYTGKEKSAPAWRAFMRLPSLRVDGVQDRTPAKLVDIPNKASAVTQAAQVITIVGLGGAEAEARPRRRTN